MQWCRLRVAEGCGQLCQPPPRHPPPSPRHLPGRSLLFSSRIHQAPRGEVLPGKPPVSLVKHWGFERGGSFERRPRFNSGASEQRRLSILSSQPRVWWFGWFRFAATTGSLQLNVGTEGFFSEGGAGADCSGSGCGWRRAAANSASHPSSLEGWSQFF